jgi:predicted component of viral defense system (DUF524 family)
MNPLTIDSLIIALSDRVSLRLEEDVPARPNDDPKFAKVHSLPETWQASVSDRRLDALSPRDRPAFIYDPTAPERGLHALRIFELRTYSWELVGGEEQDRRQIAVTSSLDHSVDRDAWRPRPRTFSGRFQFVNYLGSAWFEATVAGQSPVRISFEVASPKLDYEMEYRAMVETIGSECQQLLLEWGTPASLNLSVDPAKQKQILLEQFLFLRHVLGPDKLDLYFEVIVRNAHSRLDREVEWKPFGLGDPRFVAMNPTSGGRYWKSRLGGGPMPAEILCERKYESADTPANRFIQFAVRRFRDVCNSILEARVGQKLVFAADDAVSLEATSMLRSLDALLALPLFDNVDELRRIPFESTTLQRREGYREILIAWLMLDAAAQLDWPGREDAYDGTARNVATLYEYWLYFVLVRAFRDKLGMAPEKDRLAQTDDALPFCCRADDGKLAINLRQGGPSFCRFRWQKDDRELLVHFFYNRSFARSTVDESGSYSKTFRPDYTLVIIPAEFEQESWRATERAAERAGLIAYLHFDAKYRGENLPGLFGAVDNENDIAEHKRSRALGSVKQIDLYKMHTYNEAIRRSIGSYVIYPGMPSKSSESRFMRYHELVPGIGAFAIRPAKDGHTAAGIESICGFISDVLRHQLDRFTQSYRIRSNTEDIIRDKPVKYLLDHVEETVSLPGATAILGYMRKEDENKFYEEKAFYCRATDEDGLPLSLDLSPSLGTVFIGWCGPRSGPFVTTNWMAQVVSCRLVDAEMLERETKFKPSSKTAYYILFKLADLSSLHPRDVSSLVVANNPGPTRFRTFQTTLASVLTGS